MMSSELFISAHSTFWKGIALVLAVPVGPESAEVSFERKSKHLMARGHSSCCGPVSRKPHLVEISCARHQDFYLKAPNTMRLSVARVKEASRPTGKVWASDTVPRPASSKEDVGSTN